MYAHQKKNALEYHVQKFWGMEKLGVFPKQKKGGCGWREGQNWRKKQARVNCWACHSSRPAPCSEVKAAQMSPTFFDPMDYTVHGILQTRILGQVAFSFSIIKVSHTEELVVWSSLTVDVFLAEKCNIHNTLFWAEQKLTRIELSQERPMAIW